MRVLICGSRDWTDAELIRRVVARLPEDAIVIHGAARGADHLAERAALARGLVVYPFPADWTTYGKAAGPRRNQQMLDEGCPDVCVAFRLDGESRGTDDMIRRALADGVPVYVVDPRGRVRQA